MMLFKMLVYFVLLSLPAVILASPTCYFPDGSVASNYVSCSDGDEASHCCSTESICLTNGYCMPMTSWYTLARAACTDSSWPSDTCKNPCADVPDTNSGGCTLVLYRNEGGDILFCPSSIVANSSTTIGCASDTEPFSVPSANIVANRAVLTNASCAAHTLNPTATATATLSPSNTASAPARDSSDNNGHKETAIGAGVGVPLGALALAAAGWALVERKKRYKLINTRQPVVMPPPSDTPQVEKPPQELESRRPGTPELEGSRIS